MKFPCRRLLSTVVAVSAMLAASALLQPLAAAADSSLPIAPIGQQDPAWAAAPLGTSPTDTIGSAGCAITAVTMMLRYYGMTTDPGAFNAWLTANGGYAFDDALVWDAVTAYTGGRVVFSAWTGSDLGLVRAELDAGRPVVAEVQLDGNQHFVLIIGYTGSSLEINDPWFNDTVNFADRYGDPASGIVSMRTFSPSYPAILSWLPSNLAARHLAQ